jgi:transcriptional regulator with XRE-family HTH domain
MYITKEEMEKRLTKTDVLIKERERKCRKKSTAGDKENGEDRLTTEERTLIGVLEELDTQKNVADLMGVSQNTVSLNSRGITSVQLGVDKDLTEGIKSAKERIAEGKLDSEKKIQDQLISNLASALGHVANNLGTTDAVEASKIATDMSKILDRVTGKSNEGKNRTAIIINVPSMKKEESYQTITV